MSRNKNSDNPLVKVTLNLYQKDWEKMHGYYPVIGASVATRLLVQHHVKKIAEQAVSLVAEVPDLDIEIADAPETL